MANSHLAEEILNANCPNPALWSLAGRGFALKHHGIIFCADPAPPVEPVPAGLILVTSAAALDPGAVLPLLAASPRSKLVLPKSAAEHARSLGIPFERMQTTDSGLRVEYFKDGVYARVYAVPSKLDWTPAGGHPYLGYLLRFGGVTVYYPGQCEPYENLVERLKPYNVTVAILSGWAPSQAAQFAAEIGARWLVPAGENAERLAEHLLSSRPAQRFKLFRPGERWNVPEA